MIVLIPWVESPQHGDDRSKAGLLTPPPFPAAFPPKNRQAVARLQPKKVFEHDRNGVTAAGPFPNFTGFPIAPHLGHLAYLFISN